MKEKRFDFFAAPPDGKREEEIRSYLLSAHAPLFSTEIGKSICGRPLHLFRVGKGARALLLVGAHHGMEWITALLLYRFLDDLLVAISRRGEGAILSGDVSLYVLPLFNPDGVEIALKGARWQANARGVDLNHNYDAGFDAYREKERELGILGPAPTRYSGPYPFSEPETAAMRALLAELSPSLVLTLHTQGEEIFYKPTDPPVSGAERIGYLLSLMTGYRLGTATGAAAYGGLSDYVAEKLRRPAFTLECGLGKNPLPIGAGEGIYRRLRRALFYALLMTKEDFVWNA